MHHLRHKGMVRALGIGSFFFILSFISLLCLIGGIVAYLFDGREVSIVVFMGVCLGLAIIFRILSLFCSPKTRCQLCLGSLLSLQNCSKHRNASPFMGSYRLRLSISFLCSPSFVCIFCGEKFSTDYVDPKKAATPPEVTDSERVKSSANRHLTSGRKSTPLPGKKHFK